jgi:hypothetical protein
LKFGSLAIHRRLRRANGEGNAQRVLVTTMAKAAFVMAVLPRLIESGGEKSQPLPGFRRCSKVTIIKFTCLQRLRMCLGPFADNLTRYDRNFFFAHELYIVVTLQVVPNLLL